MLLAGRKYQSGTRWCVWRWTDVVLQGVLYLRRLHLVQTPWFAIMLHWIKRPDPQPDMHDHPVAFWSFVLRGWYIEDTPWTQMFLPRFIGPWWRNNWSTESKCINTNGATDQHRIIHVSPGGCLTLVFAGPVVRSWGFHTPQGWVPWREYQQ